MWSWDRPGFLPGVLVGSLPGVDVEKPLAVFAWPLKFNVVSLWSTLRYLLVERESSSSLRLMSSDVGVTRGNTGQPLYNVNLGLLR